MNNIPNTENDFFYLLILIIKHIQYKRIYTKCVIGADFS